MSYGVVDTGYNRKTADVLDTEIKAKITEKLGLVSFNDLGIESIFTSIIIPLTVENWEQNEALYHLSTPENASGINLDNLFSVVNVARDKPKKTKVVLTIGTNGDTDVLIPINQLVQQENTNVIFKTLEELTIPASGTITVNAESQDYGNFPASIGTITQIVTPVSGWDTVTNLSEALVGQAYQEDPDYRYKKTVDLVTSQGGVTGAIETRVRNEVDGVTFVHVDRNNTDFTDDLGLLPHSVRVVVVGGTDEAVASKIREVKGDGINTNGSIEVIVTDEEGNNTKIRFNRAEIIDIFVTYDLDVTSTYDNTFNDTIKDTVESYSNALLEGKDIKRWELESLVPMSMNDNILDVSVKFGTSASPTTNTTISISNSQKARILRSNIVINTTVI